MAQPTDLIVPDWPAPPNVRALMTTRATDLASLSAARDARWLRQVHGAAVARLEPGPAGAEPQADAAVTAAPGVVCAVKSADCLPVLFCDERGTAVGAAHAGWRGLSAGVLEATVAAMPAAPATLLAWLGAAIGPESFEVGAEVREAFLARDAGASACFVPRPAPGKYLADLYALARRRLAVAGVRRVYGGGLDTLRDPARFHSYRRDGHAGRMVALVWLEVR
ncbi:MAG: peptidoglycan editing factor PgeF [Gammaproteobacteria bacterium]